VQQPHRAENRDLGAGYEMTAAVLEQTKRKRVASRTVSRGQRGRTGFAKLIALRHIEARPDEILGEVGCRSDSDERVDTLDPGECCKRHDPPTHARSDQNLPALGQRI
jgi:hypothetical protein